MNKLLKIVMPLKDESLLSYLSRLSRANHIDLIWLFEIIDYSYMRYNIQGVNSLCNYEKIDNICHLTNLSVDDIKQMVVHRFSNGLWDNSSNAINNHFYNRFIDDKYSKFCPICMQENCYERIYWKLEVVRICHKHRVFLIDKCPRCNVNITSNIIIEGRCRCGATLEKFDYKDQISSLLYENQIRLFTYLTICTQNNKLSDNLLNNLNSDEYIRIYDFLISLCARADFSNASYKSFDYEIHNIEMVERIINNWPDLLFNVFDKVYELYIDDFNTFGKSKLDKLMNPIKLISKEYGHVQDVVLVKNAIRQYAINCYSNNYFYYQIRSILFDNRYITTHCAQKLFHIKKKLIQSDFPITIVDNRQFVELRNLLDSICHFIEYAKDYSKQDSESIKFTKVSNILSDSDRLISRLLELAYNDKVDIEIDLEKIGFDMIAFRYEKLVKCIDDFEFVNI
jgi:hypothetical protein